jgi:putative ABC transport system permease protein
VYDFDPTLSVWGVQPINGWIDGMLGLERKTLSILKVLSAVALGLAAVGLFAVLAYSVDRRMGEFGVRIALGATPGNLTWLVMRRGVVLTTLGILAGVAGSVGFNRFLRSLLYETTPYEPGVYLAVAAVLALTAAVACALPARRASRVDVARLLRAE